jgi:hypothetical protein
VAPLDSLRLQEHLHGHLGWLAALALVHPAILLRRPKRKAHLSVVLSAGLVTAVGAWGVILYPEYRERLRQPIFLHAPLYGYLFERKEHLAFGAIVLAWAGLATYLAAARGEGPLVTSLQRASHLAFVAAAGLAVAAATLGTVVAAYRTF